MVSTIGERELEAYLHGQIPLSRAMEISVVRANFEAVKLAVSIRPNLNHRQTLFGGSASAAAILAGWCLLYVRLHGREPMPKLVIMDSRVKYLKPVITDFEVSTLPIEDAQWESFLKALDRRGRGRIHADSALQADGETCCEFTGTFVALAD